MASHAKAVIIYKEPFWRTNGLSGDVISHRGLLSEIHDASSFDDLKEACYALFGFFAILPVHRSSNKDGIDAQIISQLTRVFGAEAESPIEILYKDWVQDDLVASKLDPHIPNHHPRADVTR